MFAQISLFPEQASTSAERVDRLFFFLLAVTGFFSVLVATLVIYFAVRYRRRSPTERPAISASSRTEWFSPVATT